MIPHTFLAENGLSMVFTFNGDIDHQKYRGENGQSHYTGYHVQEPFCRAGDRGHDIPATAPLGCTPLLLLFP